MKIKEAVNIINSTMTVRAKVDEGVMYVHEKLNRDDDWFMRISLYHFGWSAITTDFDTCLDDDVDVMDLSRVMDVVQRLICTPVNERFPESKYTVQVLADYDESFLNVGKDDGFAFFKDEVEAGSVQTQFTQAEIDELKQRDDLAIDWNKATIKEVKDDED